MTNPGMKNHWFAVEHTSKISSKRPTPIKLFGMPMVLYRTPSGGIQCVRDLCPHRGSRLSVGRMLNGHLSCRYHGWQFGEGGRCVNIPQHLNKRMAIPSSAHAHALPTRVLDDLVWIWPGEPAKAEQSEPYLPNPPGKDYLADNEQWYFETHYGLAMENLLDPAHQPHVHRSTLKAFYTRDHDRINPTVWKEVHDRDGVLYGHQIYENNPEKNIAHTYRMVSPWLLIFDVHFPARGFFKKWHQQMYLYMVPIDKRTCQVKIRAYRNYFTSRTIQGPLKLINYLVAKRIHHDDKIVMEPQQSNWDNGLMGNNFVPSDALVVRYRKVWEKLEAAGDPWYSPGAESEFVPCDKAA